MKSFDHALIMAQQDIQIDGGSLAGMFFFLALIFIVSIVVIVGVWKVYTKAGKPGWGSIIPIYNLILALEIAGRPIWWILLLLIPGVNFIMGIILTLDIAKNFGKGVGFGICMIFFPYVCYPILGFGDARYQPVPH